MNLYPSKAIGDVSVEMRAGLIAIITIRRAPNNFFDKTLIENIADALHWCDYSQQCRAIILTSEGKHFCAGAAMSSDSPQDPSEGNTLYEQAIRLFDSQVPIITTIQGAAIGGGLGLAMVADFRICTPQSRFSANFARLGFHHGFGLSVTLPLVIGHQYALNLLYRGHRLTGEEAVSFGLCDFIVEPDQLEDSAVALATNIASSAPLAVRAIRKTMRGHLTQEIRAATAHEYGEQSLLQETDDFMEGLKAYAERRPANFKTR